MYVNQLHELAIQHIKNGELEEALSLLNQCINEFPENPSLYTDRGTVYLHLNNKQFALVDMDYAIQLQPDYAYRYASRAFVRDHFGDTDGAIADYEIAISLDPEDAIALNNLGILMEKKGYKDAAKRKYQEADEQLIKSPSQKQKLAELVDGEPSNHPTGLKLEAKKISPATQVKQKSKAGFIFSIFTQRNTFNEFVRFIKNGFKINTND